MSSPASTRFTEAEYLALERASDRKHEFVDGRIVAMARARPPHNMIAVNVAAALLAAARPRGCAVMNSDQRVHVPATGLYTYPDVVVACGKRRYGDDNPPSLLNPTILVEVTSDATEDYDRGKKFLHYQTIPELRGYLIVSHRERRLDLFTRLDGGWRLASCVDDAGAIDLGDLGALRLDDAYAGVRLDEGRREG